MSEPGKNLNKNGQGQESQQKLSKCSAATNSDGGMFLATTVEVLPPEMLEAIFKNVESPKDLISCFNTTSAWSNVLRSIHFYFKMILLFVLPYLSRRDLLHCSSVSKSWNAIVDTFIQDAKEFKIYHHRLDLEKLIMPYLCPMNINDFINTFKLSTNNEPGNKIVAVNPLAFRRVTFAIRQPLTQAIMDQMQQDREQGLDPPHRRNLIKILNHHGHLIRNMCLDVGIYREYFDWFTGNIITNQEVTCFEKMKIIRSCLKRTPNSRILCVIITCENEDNESATDMEALNVYNAENPWPELKHLEVLKFLDTTKHTAFSSMVIHYAPKLVQLEFGYLQFLEPHLPLEGRFACLQKIVFVFFDANCAMQFGAFMQSIQCQLKHLVVSLLEPQPDEIENNEGLIIGANAVNSTLETLTLEPWVRHERPGLNYDVMKFDQLRLPKLKELCLVEFEYPCLELFKNVCPELEQLTVMPSFPAFQPYNGSESGEMYLDLYSENKFWNELVNIKIVNVVTKPALREVGKVYTRNEYEQKVARDRATEIENLSATLKVEETI